MDTPESLLIKKARIRILKSLQWCYVSGMTGKRLYSTVCAIDDQYTQTLFQSDLKYLKDKGYIVFIDEKIGGMAVYDQKVIELTPLGKGVIEGTKSDPDLEF